MSSNSPIESDVVWPPGPLYAAVLRKVEKNQLYWDNVRSVYEASKLRPPAASTLISEWSDAREGEVSGHVVRAWVLNEQGLQPIPEAEYQRLVTGPRFPYPAISFHICADGQHVVFGAVDGPHSGGGGRYRIDLATLEFHPAGDLWIS